MRRPGEPTGSGGWEGGRAGHRQAWRAPALAAALGLVLAVALGVGGGLRAVGERSRAAVQDPGGAPAGIERTPPTPARSAGKRTADTGQLRVERGAARPPPAMVPPSGAQAAAAAPPDAVAGIPPPQPGDAGIVLAPVHPRRLEDQPGAAEVLLSGEVALAGSADGALVAAVTMPGAGVARLHLFDTAFWPRSMQVQVVDGPVEMLAFTPEDDAVAWLRATDPSAPPRDTRHRVERQRIRWPHDRTSTALPPELAPSAMQPLRDGRVAVVATGPANDGRAAVRVLVVDTTAMQLLADVAVDPDWWQGTRPDLAWDVERDRLYLAGAARASAARASAAGAGVAGARVAGARVAGAGVAEAGVDAGAGSVRVVVVDLAAGAVAADTVLPSGQAPGGEAATAVPPAVAEPGSAPRSGPLGAGEAAAVSPDGSRLYLAGEREPPDPARPGAATAGQPWPGLRVVDTTTLALVGLLDAAVTAVTPTPDGRLLLPLSDGGLLIANARLERLALLEPGRQVDVLGFRQDGDVAYLRSHGADGTRVTAISLLTLRPSGQRRVDRALLEFLPGPALLGLPHQG